MSTSNIYNYNYMKEAKGFQVKKGSTVELKYNVPFGSLVVIRVTSSHPVLLTIKGPREERAEVLGSKEYRFTVDPGTDVHVVFQGKSGFFAKSSCVALEVEMYTSKDVIEIRDALLTSLEPLKELGRTYYDLNKERLKSITTRLFDVWKLLDNETKNKAKEFLSVVKLYETEKQE
ncbi:MAG: hypothetical protein QW733_00760 [Desulfurococcaceae archaeon]